MSFSRRKPYNLLGVSNKRLGGGYGTKMSMREMMHSPARYLKEKQKESVFEKPYIHTSRPDMHQQWPWPSVPWPPLPWPPWDPPPTDPNYLIVIFAPGIMGVWAGGPATCGSVERGSGFLGLQAPHFGQGGEGMLVWNIYSSDPELAQIEDVRIGLNDSSVDFKVNTKSVNEDTLVQICAELSHEGQMLHIIAVPEFVDGNLFKNMPADWDPQVNIKDPGWYGTPWKDPTVPVQPIDIWNNYKYPVDCYELQIDACETEVAPCDTSTPISWSVGNGDVITRNNSISLSVLGSGSPFNWAVSGDGEGMTVDEDEESGTVLLVADGTACGSVTVTCTDCDGNPASGSVRCTTAGSWQEDQFVCGSDWSPAYNMSVCTTYEGMYRWQDEKAHVPCVSAPCPGPGPEPCVAKDPTCQTGACTSGGCGACCFSVGGVDCCKWSNSLRRAEWKCIP